MLSNKSVLLSCFNLLVHSSDTYFVTRGIPKPRLRPRVTIRNGSDASHLVPVWSGYREPPSLLSELGSDVTARYTYTWALNIIITVVLASYYY